MSFIEPNIHPILVHFAYALIVTSTFCYVINLVPQLKVTGTLKIAADWMLAFGCWAILATIAAGFQAYFTVAHDAPSHMAMTEHRNWAVPTGIATLMLGIWRRIQRHKDPSNLFLILIIGATAALSVTAWLGGQVVYKYGIGVQSLPVITGDGHNHDHSTANEDELKPEARHGGHDQNAADADQPSTEESSPDQDHDHSDGHHDNDGSTQSKGEHRH